MSPNSMSNGPGDRYLSFNLGVEEYAVPLLAVREVIAMPEYTPVPYTPPYFLGIMNLRGQVISIMDLRQKLGPHRRSRAKLGTQKHRKEGPIPTTEVQDAFALHLGGQLQTLLEATIVTPADGQTFRLKLLPGIVAFREVQSHEATAIDDVFPPPQARLAK